MVAIYPSIMHLSVHPFIHLSIHFIHSSIHPFRVQQELMIHLIANLDNNDNPITTSPVTSSSCDTTDTEDITATELVRNILLQEILTLLKNIGKEENSEFKKENDEDEDHYDFTSFETDVSSTTPLSTPRPTPPQSPVPMEQAPPTEPVLITPVSSLSNISKNIIDQDDNISTPEVSSLMIAILGHCGKY